MEYRTLGSAPDVRKTVTILFVDLVGFSRLGHALDPEALRYLQKRFFAEMSAIVARHGGTVEKYIGDAIMAVFGIPVLHEDDALRAVRAAVEMRAALETLNRDFEAGWGVRLASRAGINTGEVIAGDHREGQLLVTGEVVNTAKRLEEAAQPNEVLIGEATHRLVRDAVSAEGAAPRPLRNGDTIPGYAVRDVAANAPGLARRFESPFVGRQGQRAALAFAFGRAVTESGCQLLTLLGGAGVGKSRLAREFTDGLPAEALVLHGRCLPYGEGITYWPLAEIMRDFARGGGAKAGPAASDQGIEAALAAKLAGVDKAGLIAERLAGVLGLGGAEGGTPEESFWAVRRLFEALARSGPLVLVMDDLHWAEPTFLDLVEHILDFSRDLPILLLCAARPELLDARPGWAQGRANAASLVLDPLTETECGELISNLFDRAPLPPAAEDMIARAAGGNALFAEELAAMLIDDGLLRREDGHWVAASALGDLPVPSSIHALLAARLEGLATHERAILTAAAIEGLTFHRSAVAELVGPALGIDDALRSLARRDLIRLDDAEFAGEEGYRFRHVLIRDAAYRSLSKSTRAELHERYASWLEYAAGTRLREYEEIVGYHLEQAYRARIAIGARDSHATQLAGRAARRLDAAGRRALARGDLPAGVGLLERAAGLLRREDPDRTPLLAELGAALIDISRYGDARRVLDEGDILAAATRDERSAAHVRVQRGFLKLLLVEEDYNQFAARAVEELVPTFGRYNDSLGICRARRLEAWVYWNEARAEAAAEAWERAADHARLAGARHVRHEILTWIASALWFGPTPAEAGIRRCEEMRAEVRESPESDAAILRHLAGLHAMEGHFDLARDLLATSNAVYDDLGLTFNAKTSQNEAIVELLAGDPAAAERSLRVGCQALEETGERMFLPTSTAFLGRAVLMQDRDDEAEELAARSAELAGDGDQLSQMLWRGLRARVLARRGDYATAETLARAAVAIADTTDFVNHRADALIDLSHVLEASGAGDPRAAAAQALDLYRLKGNAIGTAQARLHLGRLTQL